MASQLQNMILDTAYGLHDALRRRERGEQPNKLSRSFALTVDRHRLRVGRFHRKAYESREQAQAQCAVRRGGQAG